jgi:hypothetical protein
MERYSQPPRDEEKGVEREMSTLKELTAHIGFNKALQSIHHEHYQENKRKERQTKRLARNAKLESQKQAKEEKRRKIR